METLKRNKLLAEFVDESVMITTTDRKQNVSFKANVSQIQEFLDRGYDVYMPFDRSLEWVNRAIDRIRFMGHVVTIKGTSTSWDVFISIGDERLSFVAYSKLNDALFIAASQFVVWFNENAKNKSPNQ